MLGDFIEDDRIVGADRYRGAPDPARADRRRAAALPERERKIIQLRYGLNDGRYRTLEEVGREFGITRERIRQIEAKVLRKLRHPAYGRALRSYLE